MCEVEANKATVRRMLERLNAGDVAGFASALAPDYVRHCQATPDVVVTSLAEFKDYLAKEREAVPNPEVVIHRLVAEDDLVSFWATYGGIQEGPMGPFPATGKRMEIDFAGMHRIADGKIAETWVTWDNLAGLTQLGLFPPGPGEPAPE